MTPKEVLEFAKKNGVKMVDLKFMDLPGTWQHFGVPISQLEEDSFEDGYGFDGSFTRLKDFTFISSALTGEEESGTPGGELTLEVFREASFEMKASLSKAVGIGDWLPCLFGFKSIMMGIATV